MFVLQVIKNQDVDNPVSTATTEYRVQLKSMYREVLQKEIQTEIQLGLEFQLTCADYEEKMAELMSEMQTIKMMKESGMVPAGAYFSKVVCRLINSWGDMYTIVIGYEYKPE